MALTSAHRFCAAVNGIAELKRCGGETIPDSWSADRIVTRYCIGAIWKANENGLPRMTFVDGSTAGVDVDGYWHAHSLS